MSIDGRELAAIFAGGVIGTLARAEVGELLPHVAAQWPFSTLLVNILGAFMLGGFTTRLQEPVPRHPHRRSFLGTGFCGALTTFSTMQIELLGMLDHGRYWLAAAYALVSISGGFMAIALATGLVRRSRVAR